MAHICFSVLKSHAIAFDSHHHQPFAAAHVARICATAATQVLHSIEMTDYKPPCPPYDPTDEAGYAISMMLVLSTLTPFGSIIGAFREHPIKYPIDEF